jgi:hypothetical protein
MENSALIAAPASKTREKLLPSLRHSDAAWWQLLGIALTLALQTDLLFTRAINWDEFFYYYQVYGFATGGALSQPLQTLHVRLFGWILGVGNSAVDQIIAARCVMLLCEAVTAAAITGIAAKFTDRATGLLCALSYLSAGFVFQHGFAFRVDPMAAACLMSALWILCTARLDIARVALFGLLVAAGGLITIKVTLYAPVFAGLAWYRWNEDERSIASAMRLAAAAVLACLFFSALYVLHSQGVSSVAQASITGTGGASRKILADSAQEMFSLGPQPYWQFIPSAVAKAVALTVFIVLVPIALIDSGRKAAEKIALVGMLMPLSTLVFYHNTAPYYYAFMLPPVATACCISVTALRSRFDMRLLSIVFAINSLMVWATDGPSRIDNQRRIIDAAHEIFPEPVGYFDFCYLLSDFPKMNGFMTLWGVDSYLATGKLVYRDALMTRSVPLLVEDDPMYSYLMREGLNFHQFAPEDARTLRATYIHFWGPFWVAGQELRAGAAARSAEMLVPGLYTARGGPISVDGRRIEDGAVVMLGRGIHRLAALSGDAKLVWGNRLVRPRDKEPGEMWTFF